MTHVYTRERHEDTNTYFWATMLQPAINRQNCCQSNLNFP